MDYCIDYIDIFLFYKVYIGRLLYFIIWKGLVYLEIILKLNVKLKDKDLIKLGMLI